MSFEIRDDKDRVIIKVDEKGKIAAARYPDLSEEFKQYIVETYAELTNEDPEKLKRFLDYEEEDDEFCV